VFDDLPVRAHPEDVHNGLAAVVGAGAVVRVDRHQVPLGDHPLALHGQVRELPEQPGELRVGQPVDVTLLPRKTAAPKPAPQASK